LEHLAEQLAQRGLFANGQCCKELTVRWNYLNLCRIALVGAVITALFQAFRRLDRLTLPA
jgi:hypothetical protein